MTQEEKAKRYDEAIEIARQYYNDRAMPIGTNFKLERMFPELMESEDEKIRKWLISTLKSLNSSPVQIDDVYEMMLPAIAWLEKQGEKGIKRNNGEIPNSDWSDEDEYHKRQILRILKDNGCSQTLQEKTEKWIEERLKSLRPQNRWKPTKRQLLELSSVISGCSFDTPVLVELEEDLMKLMKE